MSLQGHIRWVWAIKFSPDGKMASCAEDGTIRFWNINTGKSLHTIEAHSIRCSSIGALELVSNYQSTSKVLEWTKLARSKSLN